MTRYSNKNRKSWRIWGVVILVLVGLYYVGIRVLPLINRLNTDKILAQSLLKNKKFAAQVQQVNSAGLSAYLLEEHSNPIVSIDFEFKNAGRAHEAEKQQGLTNVLADMLLNGTVSYSAETFKDLSEEYGIKISFRATKDTFSGSLIFPVQYKKMAVKLMKETLLQPRFDEDYLELTKQQLLTALKMSEEHPARVLNDKYAEFVFEGHPYSRHSIGQKENIAQITAEDLRNFMQSYLAQNNLIIGIAGDITTEDTKTLLKDLFGALPQKSFGQDLLPLEIISSGEELNIDKDTAQVIVRFVTKGTYRNSLDFYPLYMANYIFGASGLSSRLNKNIREKEGLTYGIHTWLDINDASALLEGSYSVTPDNFVRAKELLLDEWQKMANGSVSEKELQFAKDALVTSFNLRFSAIDDISAMLLAMQKYRLGIDFLDKRNDYIQSITVAEVNAAAKKYFSVMPNFVTIGVKEKK